MIIRFEVKNNGNFRKIGREMSRFIVITCHFQTALLSSFYLAVTDKRVVMLSDAFPRLPRPRRRVHQEIYRVEWPVMSITVLTLYSPVNLLKNRVEHSFVQSYESSRKTLHGIHSALWFIYYGEVTFSWKFLLKRYSSRTIIDPFLLIIR